MDICLEGIRQQTGNKPGMCCSNLGKSGGIKQPRENNEEGGK